jgi:hypothetical protein
LNPGEVDRLVRVATPLKEPSLTRLTFSSSDLSGQFPCYGIYPLHGLLIESLDLGVP